MANFQLPVSYQTNLTVDPVDAEGNAVADTLTWTNSDTTGATVLTVAGGTTLVATVAAPVLATPVSPLPVNVIITAADATGNSVTFELDVVADLPTGLSVTASPLVKIPATT